MCVGISHVPSGYLVTTGIRSRWSGFSTFLDVSRPFWIFLDWFREVASAFFYVCRPQGNHICVQERGGRDEGGRGRERESERESERECEGERERETAREREDIVRVESRFEAVAMNSQPNAQTSTG